MLEEADKRGAILLALWWPQGGGFSQGKARRASRRQAERVTLSYAKWCEPTLFRTIPVGVRVQRVNRDEEQLQVDRVGVGAEVPQFHRMQPSNYRSCCHS